MFLKELVSTILFLISPLPYPVTFIPLQKLRNIDILIHGIERTIQRSLSICSVLNAAHIKLMIQHVSFTRLKDTLWFKVFHVPHINQMYRLMKGTNKCAYLMFCWRCIAIHPYNMNQKDALFTINCCSSSGGSTVYKQQLVWSCVMLDCCCC
jgi:hypothetical protein